MAKIVDRIFNTVLTAMDSSAQEELGSFRFEDGKIYKYVQFVDAVTATVGAPVILDGTSNYTVTVDVNAGVATSGEKAICGVTLVTNVQSSCGWIQIYGVGTVAITTLATAGDHLIASTDNYWAVGTFGTDSEVITSHYFGAVALETYGYETAGTMIAFIRCM